MTVPPERDPLDLVDDVTLGRAILEGLFDDQLGLGPGRYCPTCDTTWTTGPCPICEGEGLEVDDISAHGPNA